jgi:hypothetical protein
LRAVFQWTVRVKSLVAVMLPDVAVTVTVYALESCPDFQ